MAAPIPMGERNRLANIYRREAQAHGIVSPFRQMMYIESRLKGKSEIKSIEYARKGKV